jgi:glycosyltransferase involved in cell wall biosynthesis
LDLVPLGFHGRTLGKDERDGCPVKIVILSSTASSLINFRGRLIADLAAAGHQVIASAPDHDQDTVDALTRMGVRFRRISMARAGLNPLQDLKTLVSFIVLLRRERPDLVLAYTQKPIIYGGLAARLTGTSFFVIMSGLGYVFSDACAHRPWLRRTVAALYRHAVRRARTIFVFNSDDARCMAAHGIIDRHVPIVQVPGSGVDLDHFAECPMPRGPPTFIMIARLMRDKGVADYVQAASLVRDHVPDARFRLLGKSETDNPTGLSAETVKRWVQRGLVEHLPECTDVRPHLADAHVFVLPSFYREGLPRTLLEALATGRPVITTDMPGCREPVIPGENGWLVPCRQPRALADAMLQSIASRAKLERMGRRSREIAEERFDVVKVNHQMLRSMRIEPSSGKCSAQAPQAVSAAGRA